MLAGLYSRPIPAHFCCVLTFEWPLGPRWPDPLKTQGTWHWVKGDILWKQLFSWDLGLWSSHTHTNFEKSLYMIIWVRYAFLKVPHLQLPNKPVSFSAQLNITSHFPTPLQSEHSNDFVDQRTNSSGGGNSAAALQLSSRSTIPFSSGLPPKLRRQSGGGDMEEKGIVLQELSCSVLLYFKCLRRN